MLSFGGNRRIFLARFPIDMTNLLHLASAASVMASTYVDAAPVVPGNPRWMRV